MTTPNILLVIGSVKADRYQTVRREMRQDGVKPKVCRVRDVEIFDIISVEGWVAEAIDHDVSKVPLEHEWYANTRGLSYEEKLAAYLRMFHDLDPEDVHSMVFPREQWRRYVCPEDAFKNLKQRYVVRDDGSLEYV